MRCFGWSERHCRLGITSAQGQVWYNWALENEMTAFGPIVKRATDGYVAQHKKALLKKWAEAR
jgi:hypothetical protein